MPMFGAALFTTAKDGNSPRPHQQMNKQNVLGRCNGILLSHKKGMEPQHTPQHE